MFTLNSAFLRIKNFMIEKKAMSIKKRIQYFYLIISLSKILALFICACSYNNFTISSLIYLKYIICIIEINFLRFSENSVYTHIHRLNYGTKKEKIINVRCQKSFQMQSEAWYRYSGGNCRLG